jgi:small conductance mechanosensitive channel
MRTWSCARSGHRVLLFAIIVALDKFGFQIAPLVAGIGVAGLGLGFALQGVLSNVIAGLTIIFTKPFRVGEHIEIVGVRGDVTTIELFSTTLVHPDRSRIIIPNRKIVGEILHNFGTLRQIHLAVMVPHDTDLAKALARPLARS